MGDPARGHLRDESSPRRRVLCVCTHNAARSQIGAALLAREGRDRFDVASAGSEPALDAVARERRPPLEEPQFRHSLRPVRYALILDIHANLPALEAVIAEIADRPGIAATWARRQRAA